MSNEKPVWVTEVEARTGLLCKQVRSNSMELWRLVSPTGIPLFIIVGDVDTVEGVGAVDYAALQGITEQERARRRADRKKNRE